MAGFEGEFANHAQLAAASVRASLDTGPASFDFVNAGFEKLVGAAETLGANHGDAAVIDLYQRWIGTQAGGIKYMYAAWFNLGAELSLAGDMRGAMLAYQ